MYIEWTYALVCRYAKHVRSNVETPIVRTRRVGGRALAGRREREERTGRERSGERGRARREVKEEPRHKGVYEKEGTRERRRSREALLLRSMPRTYTCMHTRERAPAPART